MRMTTLALALVLLSTPCLAQAPDPVATLVVIVTVIVASIFLGIFDAMWAYLTGHLYG